MRTLLNKNTFQVTFDTQFRNVIEACSTSPRKNQDGTWITNDMIEAYCVLHELGFAHSVEARREGELVGGIYGVSLGTAFFGESIFNHQNNTSKITLITLIKHIQT